MKQFLRYQISGSVFILWVIIFYFSAESTTLIEFIKGVHKSLDLNGWKVLFGAAIALPFGVLIHQFSVVIKNCIIGVCFPNFCDFPREDEINKLNEANSEKNQYIMEHISNLHSFYYVRFDNAVLAPFIAWFTVSFFLLNDSMKINYAVIYTAIIISVITITYIFRIHEEIGAYKKLLSGTKTTVSKTSCVKILVITFLLVLACLCLTT